MSARRAVPAEIGMKEEAPAVDSGFLDEAAFARLHAQTARPLWSYLYRSLGDAAKAEDLVQETFLRALKARIATLSEDEQRAYVFRIAGNLAVDAWRQRKREDLAMDAVEREAASEIGPQVRDLDVARSLARLNPQQRALLWLAYVEGSAHEEIAHSLKLKPASIRVLLFRARRRLRDLVAKPLGELR